MRIGSLMVYVTMAVAALLCIGVTVLSLMTGDYTVSTVGALFICSMALGAVTGVSVLKYVPAYVSSRFSCRYCLRFSLHRIKHGAYYRSMHW